jgi:hypothetical protein
MKHILNDISQDEKNRILEQHNGGKILFIENFDKLVNNRLGTVRTLVNEQSVSATTQVCQQVPAPIEGLNMYLNRTPDADGQYDSGANNMIELPDGTYSFVDANNENTKKYAWVYVVDSKKCWTGYLLGIGSLDGAKKLASLGQSDENGNVIPFDPTKLTLNITNTNPKISDGTSIGAVHNWKQNKYPKSSVKGLTIREQVSTGTTSGTTTGETTDSVYNDFISKGYKDITSWYFSPQGVVYIPDGSYSGKGWGYYENILTNDGKDTGYVLILMTAVRGERKDTVQVAKNGGAIGSTGGKISKILLNDTILNSSGLKKQ